MDRHGKVGFNKSWTKSVSKQQFIDAHKDVYDHVNLAAEYDKIVGPEKPVKETVKKEAPKKAAKK